MIQILDTTGRIASKARNLSGLRRYARIHPVQAIHIGMDGGLRDAKGWLYVRFENGSECQTSFASYRVLAGWLRRWRSAYGAELWIGEHQQTTPLCAQHASLREIERRLGMKGGNQ